MAAKDKQTEQPLASAASGKLDGGADPINLNAVFLMSEKIKRLAQNDNIAVAIIEEYSILRSKVRDLADLIIAAAVLLSDIDKTAMFAKKDQDGIAFLPDDTKELKLYLYDILNQIHQDRDFWQNIAV